MSTVKEIIFVLHNTIKDTKKLQDFFNDGYIVKSETPYGSTIIFILEKPYSLQPEKEIIDVRYVESKENPNFVTELNTLRNEGFTIKSIFQTRIVLVKEKVVKP